MLKKIFIENLTCSASVGVYENEKLNKQKLIINAANTKTYKGWPGFIANEKLCKKLKDSFSPNQVDKEAGNNKKVLAKIAGITPAIFTLNGKWLVCACINLLPCCL